jgi:predicted amidohydrolase
VWVAFFLSLKQCVVFETQRPGRIDTTNHAAKLINPINPIQSKTKTKKGYMMPTSNQQRIVPRVRAFENNVYVAVANMAGRDKVYSYFGHSCVINFDGEPLAELSGVPDEVTYATLSLTAIR